MVSLEKNIKKTRLINHIGDSLKCKQWQCTYASFITLAMQRIPQQQQQIMRDLVNFVHLGLVWFGCGGRVFVCVPRMTI